STAQGKDCDLCSSGGASAAGNATSSFALFASLCSFPPGSSVVVSSGALRVVAPAVFQGGLQVDAQASLVFDHAQPTYSATAITSGVSVLDPHDGQGKALSIINEGRIIVRKG